MEQPTYRIDGAAFADLRGLFDEIEEQLLHGQPCRRTMAGLDELLRGGVGPLPREFRLVWEHADLSRRRLGHAFDEILAVVARHPNVELVLS